MLPMRHVLLAVCTLGAACSGRRQGAPEPFVVERAALPEAETVLLNDPITVVFSAPLDPMSVTSDSVAVVDERNQAVRGRLRVGANWVTFEPEPPLAPTLDDGSFAPGAVLRLAVAGYPRSDAVRAADGRRLSACFQATFRAAALDEVPAGLPAPLRPVLGGALPFLLRPQAIEGRVPIDEPRLRLFCTLPVLPSSVTAEAFEISLVQRNRPLPAGPPALRIAPRSVRIARLPAGAEEYPGSTIEIDLGSSVRLHDGAELLPLTPGDLIAVKVTTGRKPLRDYSGQPLQVAVDAPHWWEAVPGSRVLWKEWTVATANRDGFRATDDLAVPDLEWSQGVLRPRVRVEAGDGSLGVFRPQQDTSLVPGQPFDRGDGTLVVDDGGVYAFAAIDVPAGVTVTVDPRGGRARLLASGRARIAGRLLVPPLGVAQSLRQGDLVDFGSVVESAAVTLLAAGGAAVTGAVELAPGAADGVSFALVAAGPVDLRGPIPLGSLLATEPDAHRVQGLAQRVLGVKVRLTPGMPTGAVGEAAGWTGYEALPPGCTAGAVQRLDCGADVRLDWQSVPPDPVRGGADLDPARATPPRAIDEDGEFAVLPGSFVRFRCTIPVRGGQPLRGCGGLRVFER